MVLAFIVRAIIVILDALVPVTRCDAILGKFCRTVVLLVAAFSDLIYVSIASECNKYVVHLKMTHKSTILLLCVLLCGCFYIGKDTYKDIVSQQPSKWSERDALIVLAAPTAHNLFDIYTNVKVIATPYYPSVILAIERRAQRIHHWNDEEFHENAEQLLRDDLGMRFQWQTGRIENASGDSLYSPLQFDSLMFLVTLENRATTAFTARVYERGASSVPLVSMENQYIPDITDLSQRIFLLNQRGDTLRPRYIWGRRNNQLTLPENLFVMFYLRQQGKDHFLAQSREKMTLLVKGFEKDICLDFPLTMMR